jgi:hypothetical protein
MTGKRIWRLVERYGEDFAQCWLRSPPEEIDEPCGSCTVRTTYRIPAPLVLEWEAGSDKIGDFVWPGGGRVALTKTAFDQLAASSLAVQAGPIEMIQDPKLRKPTRKGKGKPRVWLPYGGPPLVELVVQESVSFLPKTTTKIRNRCKVCGAEALDLDGVEEKGTRWDPKRQDLVRYRKPRVAGKGIFISAAALGERSIFRIAEPFSSGIYCTDNVREFITTRQFSNVDFLDFGDIL